MEQWKALEVKRIYVLKEFQEKELQALMNFALDYAMKNKYEVVAGRLGTQLQGT
jgi:hypothetical protein